jgi:excisionase family DNA binding protein
MASENLEKIRAFRMSLRRFADELLKLMREADRLEAALGRREERDDRAKRSADDPQPVTLELPTTKLAYTMAEVAKATGVGRSTLWRLRRAGELKAWKCGGKTLIKAEELQRWLASLPRA